MDISTDITIEELMKNHPEVIRVLMDYGIRALVCGEPTWGTLGEVAEKSGVEDIDALLSDLRDVIEKS